MVAVPAGARTPAGAQAPQVRLAAAADCPRNVNCIPGFKRVYGIDPTSVFTPLQVADTGIQALDNGLAEVAVAFSSNPQLSRPDVLALDDDKGMYEGIPCSRRTVRAGSYPATRPFGIVICGRPARPLRRFLRWIGTSATARRVIATRYVPV